jgi:hypothetical protein
VLCDRFFIGCHSPENSVLLGPKERPRGLGLESDQEQGRVRGIDQTGRSVCTDQWRDGCGALNPRQVFSALNNTRVSMCRLKDLVRV